jgi:hypothetical protein
LLRDLGVRVELVDQSGTIVASSVKGFQNLHGGSVITVKGKVERKGKGVVIRASALYVG